MSKEVRVKKFGRHYLDSFKQEVVKEAELEGSLALICARHGLSSSGLQEWMNRYGSENYHENKSRRRSLSERDQIARDIDSGHLSIEESMVKYSISRHSVSKWLLDYRRSQNSLLPESIVSVASEAVVLQVSSSDLKLAELKIRALEVMLDIASKEFKVDIRKKFGAKR
jgi:transposase